MTHTEIIDKVSDAMSNRVTLDDRTLEYLEEVLIGADLGVDTSWNWSGASRRTPSRTDDQRRQAAQAALRRGGGRAQRDAPPAPLRPRPHADPGGGRQRRRQNHLDRQARAAASAKRRTGDARGGTPSGPPPSSNSASGASGWALKSSARVRAPTRAPWSTTPSHAARARKIDQLIVDTAGRLHTKDHLMPS